MALLAVVLTAGVAGCEQAPEEPAGSGRPLVKREPLKWTAPPGWTVERTAKSGVYRAKYDIPAAGDGKHPATLLVWTVDSAKDLEKERADLVTSFEGENLEPKSDSTKVGELDVTFTEIAGRYKHGVGKPRGKEMKFPAHVMKDDWRAILATVDAPKRGRWVFRMVGPDDTVLAARGAFRTMIQGLK
jgi:hypothetical protein